jgi:3-oxoacid CoA-transferase subunit A
MNKVFESVQEAVADIKSGLGGFFTAGSPSTLIKALARTNATNLTIIAQSAGVGNKEVNELIDNGKVTRFIGNYPFFRSATKGSQHTFEQMVRKGQLKVEAYPMGTFIEKLRAGGGGIAGFYTRAGAGTDIAAGKESRVFNDHEYILEMALQPDYSFVHAYMGDTEGNLIYRKTARNYNPVMACAGKVTIAEVENLVEAGKLDPDKIHTPSIYVQRVVKVERIKVIPGID